MAAWVLFGPNLPKRAQFVTGLNGELVQFGYSRQRTADTARNISRGDVQWFVGFASWLTESQLRHALQVSGASDDEASRFACALIERIRRLREVAAS